MTPKARTVTSALLCLLTFCAATPAEGSDLTEDETALRHLKTELWPRAYRTGDTQLLDQLLHNSFQLIGADGSRSTKAQELAWIAENEWNPGEFEYRIERLDVYGDMAIVAGEGVATGYRYRSSNVLIREDGRWRAVASHVSGFATIAADD